MLHDMNCQCDGRLCSKEDRSIDEIINERSAFDLISKNLNNKPGKGYVELTSMDQDIQAFINQKPLIR